jgi:HAAS domain-containing protein
MPAGRRWSLRHAPPAEAPGPHAAGRPIAEYLVDLERALPRGGRKRFLRETTTHLEDVADDWEARGLPRPLAERRAVVGFGEPSRLAGIVRSDRRDRVNAVVLRFAPAAATAVIAAIALDWHAHSGAHAPAPAHDAPPAHVASQHPLHRRPVVTALRRHHGAPHAAHAPIH